MSVCSHDSSSIHIDLIYTFRYKCDNSVATSSDQGENSAVLGKCAGNESKYESTGLKGPDCGNKGTTVFEV